MKYLIALLALFTLSAFASERDCYECQIMPTTTMTQRTDENVYQSMGAMAFATSNVHFDQDTDKIQVGIGTGYFEGVTAGSVAVGKTLFGGPLLSINAAQTVNGGGRGTGYGAGLTFQF